MDNNQIEFSKQTLIDIIEMLYTKFNKLKNKQYKKDIATSDIVVLNALPRAIRGMLRLFNAVKEFDYE